MEPFTILCTTCQSRIRVRNAAMIGQIVNCPKCSAMLMVALPQKVEFEAPGNAPVDSMAMTKEGIAPSSLPVAISPANDTWDKDMAPPEVSRSGSVADGLQDGDFAKGVDWSEETASDAAESSAWQPPTEPLVPTADWTSEATARKRQYLLVGFLGFSGLVIAGVLFTLFLQWYSATPKQDPQVALNNGQAAVGTEVQASPPEVSDPANDPNATVDATDPLMPTTPAGLSDNPSFLPEGLDNDAKPDAPDADPTATEASQSDSAGADMGTESDSTAADTPTTDSSTAEDTNPDDTTDALAEPSLDIPKGLAGLESILGLPDRVLNVPETMVLPTEPPVTADELGLADATDLPSVPAIDWQERSQTVVPAIIIGERSLSHAVNLWNLISGTPTVVDLDSLAAAGIDRKRKVSLQRKQPLELGELANALATEAELVVAPEENRMLQFRASSDAIRAKVPLKVAVDDLIAPDADAQWLKDSLDLLFPGSPDGWKLVDNELTVDLDQTDLITWFSVLRTLENWRSQAGKPTQLADFSPPSLALPIVDLRNIKALDTQLTNIAERGQPVAQLLTAISDEAGLDCWIDWPALGPNGLGPSTTATVVTHARPARRAMLDIAKEFNLEIALLDEQTLWITSVRAYRRQPQVYVIPSQGRTAQRWAQDLREYTPAGPRGIGKIDAVLTPDEAFVIVRCCRPAIRY